MAALARQITRFYGANPLAGEELPRIVNRRHFDRLAGLLSGGRIAVGGQTVDINDEDGLVYVDGVALSEPYTRGLPSYTLASDVSYPYTVPEGYLWMMGDNRTNSQDSRFFGAIPVSSVTGRGALVYWPLNDFSLLD